MILDPLIRLTYSWPDSGRGITSRSFVCTIFFLLNLYFFNLSKIILFEMTLKRGLLPKSQWVIRFCLDVIYLNLDLSGDLILYVTVKGHSKPVANHPVGTQNMIISDMSSKEKKKQRFKRRIQNGQ